MIQKHANDRDGYWEFMELLYMQLDSMAQGVVKKLNGTVSHEEVYRKILRMNYFQDLFELSAKFAPSKDIRQSCNNFSHNFCACKDYRSVQATFSNLFHWKIFELDAQNMYTP